ncbi:MAG: alpha/beta hydrolase [Candidatus Hydrogenedentales bacterium]
MIRRSLIVTAVAGICFAAAIGFRLLATSRAEATFPTSGRFLTVGDTRLHYIEDGSGPAVILLHGNPGFVRDWFALLPVLAAKYRTVAFDRLGHGYSSRPSDAGVSPSIHARVMHDASKTLAIGCPVIVGHSWGSALALIYAVESPGDTCGLVLLGPRAFPRENKGALYRVLRLPILGTVLRSVIPAPIGRHMVATGLAEAYAPAEVNTGHLATAQALWTRPSQLAATVWDTQNLNEALRAMTRRYGEIRIPVTILVGDRDVQLQEAISLQREIAGAQLKVVQGAGHELAQVRPDLVSQAVDQIHQRAAAGSSVD